MKVQRVSPTTNNRSRGYLTLEYEVTYEKSHYFVKVQRIYLNKKNVQSRCHTTL